MSDVEKRLADLEKKVDQLIEMVRELDPMKDIFKSVPPGLVEVAKKCLVPPETNS